AINSAEKARSTLGENALIMIDTYMSWNQDVTLEMAKILSPYNIHWFEDVLTPDDLVGQANIRTKVKPTLIAGGEHEFTHYGFMELARSAALDIWQPDITWCGGITAGLRIIEIAKTFGIPVIPHRGGEVWGLHLIVSSDCQDLAEVLPGTKGAHKDELWAGEPQAEDGYIEPNDQPGFGVNINESLLS
ncbi:MAG: enolase C-terminal domain-like protein, partial [Chloroflexota bacterium]|nr:enolase C-terminal domain-like protein [Chloroflexota bacterium]